MLKKYLNPQIVFTDKEERYVAIEITYDNKKTLVVNIYAPNGSKKDFFKEIQRQLDNKAYEKLIMVGDFNGIIDNTIDRISSKSKKKMKKGKLPNTFF